MDKLKIDVEPDLPRQFSLRHLEMAVAWFRKWLCGSLNANLKFDKVNSWYLLENKTDYDKATTKYEEMKLATKGSPEYKEKLLLAFLINQYENKQSTLPEVDPVELIKIRMEDFGCKAADLAREYGDKGTVSKVLNYKQSLSLAMICKFSKILSIPADLLLKEYKLN